MTTGETEQTEFVIAGTINPSSAVQDAAFTVGIENAFVANGVNYSATKVTVTLLGTGEYDKISKVGETAGTEPIVFNADSANKDISFVLTKAGTSNVVTVEIPYRIDQTKPTFGTMTISDAETAATYAT